MPPDNVLVDEEAQKRGLIAFELNLGHLLPRNAEFDGRYTTGNSVRDLVVEHGDRLVLVKAVLPN